jgi:hypothetical protein
MIFCIASGPCARTAMYSRTLRNARDLRVARADVRDAGRLDEQRPSSMMSDWRRVRRQIRSLFASGLERKLGSG